MTNDPEERTPFDAAIDEVARAMTRVRTPDVRGRVSERVETRPRKFAWWQPALAAAVLLVGVLWSWPVRDDAVPAPPLEQTARQPEPAPAPFSPDRLSPALSASSAPLTTRVPAAARRSPPEPAETVALMPALAVESIALDAIAVERGVLIDAVEMPALVVEPLDVEPLPRSNP